MAQMVKNMPAMQEIQFIPRLGRSSGEENGLPNPAFLPGKSHGQRSLAGYSPWGCKKSDTTERLTFSISRVPTVSPIHLPKAISFLYDDLLLLSFLKYTPHLLQSSSTVSPTFCHPLPLGFLIIFTYFLLGLHLSLVFSN